jgi:hypothetical protein
VRRHDRLYDLYDGHDPGPSGRSILSPAFYSLVESPVALDRQHGRRDLPRDCS